MILLDPDGAAGAWANGGKLNDFVIGMGIGMVAGGIGEKLSGAISEKITWFARGLQQAALTGAVAGSLGGAMGSAVYGRDVWKGARNGAVMGGAAGSVGYLFRGVMAQGGDGGSSSRSGLGNALRNVPILGGIFGGVGDTLSGVGNIAVGNFGTGFSQIGGGLGRTIGNVWALPNTAVGLAYGGVGMVFGARPVWDSHDAILRFTNMPGWLMPSAMSLGHVQVYGPRGVMQPNRFGTPAIVEENLHTRQAEILGPLYLPLHGLTMGGSILTGGGTHRNNLLEMAPERGVGLWPWNINE